MGRDRHDQEVSPHMHGAAMKVARYAAIPLLLFVALAAWALSSPVGATPDEEYHLSSIWCGQGTEAGQCEEGPQADQREVPVALPHASICYAFHPENSAACQNKWFVEESDRLVPTARGDFTGDYPPAFYFTMNFFVGGDISKSVLAMRVFNSALFVGVMSLLYWFLPRGRRTMLVLGSAVTMLPLGIFLIPSINPSGWSFLSAAVVFPALVGYFETAGRRRILLAALAGLGTLFGAGARADSAVYLVIAVVLATLVSTPWRKDSWKLLLYPLLLCLACAASYLSSGQSGAASSDVDADATYTVAQQIGFNLLNAPTLWQGSLGSWGLGWLDTSMPSAVPFLNLVVFGAVVFLGIRQTNLRKGISLVLVLAAGLVIPTWVLLQTSDLVGVGVQPRYLLPLLVLFAQVALFRIAPGRTDFSRTQLMVVAAALTLTNAIALHYNIRRYVTGTDVFRFDLDFQREWWWALPVPPMATWVLGSLAFGVVAFLSARALLARTEGVEGHTTDTAEAPHGLSSVRAA
jgi:hypothetical protein